MDKEDAMRVMAALSQPTRLAAYERLLDELPMGMSSSGLAEAVSCSPTSMSAHLAVLSRAGLVDCERRGRHALYSARRRPLERLADFLAVARRDRG